MRRTYNAQWVADSDKFVGVNLGADYCAEHEWGIKTLKSEYGIDLTDAIGLDKRKITKVPTHVKLFETKIKYRKETSIRRLSSKKAWVLISDSFLNFPGWEDLENPKVIEDMLNRPCDGIDYVHTDITNEGFINAAWDEGGFAVVSDDKEKLQELYDAIQNKDVVIGRFGGGIFQNAGLGVYIVSKLSKDVIKEWERSDQDAIDLENASKEIGIKDQLDYFNQQHYDKGGMSYTAPFGYHALRAAWVNEKRKGKTKHKVMYWLNPMGQDRNNYGWFTVEELEQWIEGRGPIPKKKRGHQHV